MAGDWIKMRTDLLTSPKVVRIASALNADRFRIAGGLLSVWSLFDVHSADGVLHGYTVEALDDLAAWPGFSAAMIGVGWLIESDGNLELPRFDVHNGASAKRRCQDADRKKNVRKTSASEADKMRTREEKRREEKIESKPPSFPPVEEKPPARKTKIPSPFLLTSDMRSWAAESAPGVDLKTETEKFVDYWRAEAKTKADWPATWRNWIRKAQQDHNRPSARGGQPINRQQQIEDANQAVVLEIAERERLRRLAEQGKMPQQDDFISTGDIIIEGEYIHAK